MKLGRRLLNEDELETDDEGKYITRDRRDIWKLPETPRDVYREDLDWMKNWINSRRHIQRDLNREERINWEENNPVEKKIREFARKHMSIGDEDSARANRTIDDSLNRISNVSIRDDRFRSSETSHRMDGSYNRNKHSVYASNSDLASQAHTLTHELAHASGLQSDKATLDKIKQVTDNSRTYENFWSLSNENYYKSPREIHSRIFQIRRLIDLKPGEKVNEDMLRWNDSHTQEQGWNLHQIMNTIPLSTEEVAKLMNEIVYNDSNEEQSNFG